MTLISKIVIDDIPIIFGDILTSIQTTDATQLFIPTLGSFSSQFTNDHIYKPYSLCQKVNLLSPSLAIAWSGNLDSAREYFSQIICSKSHINPKIEIIEEITRDIPSEDNLQLIGLLCDQTGIRTFSRNCEMYTCVDSEISEIIAGGTGSKKLFETVENSHVDLTCGVPSSSTRVIGNTLRLYGSLLSQEYLNHTTIKNLFGAGYEFVLPTPLGLEKFSDITYVFWTIKVDQQTGTTDVTPTLILKQYYFLEYLITRTVEISNLLDFEDTFLVIPPVYPTTTIQNIEDIPKKSLTSQYMMSLFQISIDGIAYFSSEIGVYSSDLAPIIFDEKDSNSIEFTINTQFVKNQLLNLKTQIKK